MQLEKYLLLKRMTPIDLAYMLKVSLSTVYRYLNGDKPKIRIARIIEEKTEKMVTVEDLMGNNYESQ